MPKFSLIIHEYSYPYIKNNSEFFLRVLKDIGEGDADIQVVGSVNDAELEAPCTAFVIGEQLGTFSRVAGVRYVFLNFSVVSFIGDPRSYSVDGAKMILRKRRLLNRKIKSFDAVFEYYPAQYRRIRHRLARPVFPFLPCSAPRAAEELADRAFDVCFVGGLSPRRTRVLEQLQGAGVRLSPHNGDVIEAISAQSRVHLNIHFQKSNHLEIPRLAAGLSVGTPIVTEHSHAIEDVVGSGAVLTGEVDSLCDITLSLLSDPERLARMSDAVRAEYERYAGQARELTIASVLAAERIPVADGHFAESRGRRSMLANAPLAGSIKSPPALPGSDRS